MYMGILPARMSVLHTCSWCPQKTEEHIGCPGTGVKADYEQPCGC